MCGNGKPAFGCCFLPVGFPVSLALGAEFASDLAVLVVSGFPSIWLQFGVRRGVSLGVRPRR